ncbi:hypothetical protein [Breoghania sp. JC706]|uniref:hypothetical protein n=1 Tax=Breoghania sp. JC706 TaxID=3117732 RepID=UPI0030093865
MHALPKLILAALFVALLISASRAQTPTMAPAPQDPASNGAAVAADDNAPEAASAADDNAPVPIRPRAGAQGGPRADQAQQRPCGRSDRAMRHGHHYRDHHRGGYRDSYRDNYGGKHHRSWFSGGSWFSGNGRNEGRYRDGGGYRQWKDCPNGAANPARSGTAQPPANGLFNKGAAPKAQVD